jgi:hypothetical protein
MIIDSEDILFASKKTVKVDSVTRNEQRAKFFHSSFRKKRITR